MKNSKGNSACQKSLPGVKFENMKPDRLHNQAPIICSAAFASFMEFRHIIWLGVVSTALLQTVFGQGFVNLNFEQATIAPTPVGGSTYPADPAQLFPGWIAGPNTVVSYNDLSLGSSAADLMGPNFPNGGYHTPLQGSYSVLLQYLGAYAGPPTLSQTGMVPANAQSINFLVSSSEADAVVTLNGVPISLTPIAGGRLAGDVTAFAGTEAQLTFSTIVGPAYPGDSLYFDDVQFSSSPVPEPSVCSLFGINLLFLGWYLKRPKLRTGRTCQAHHKFRIAGSP